MKLWRRPWAVVLASLLCLVLAACAARTGPAPDRAALKERLQTYWDAKTRQDCGAAYDMFTNAYKAEVTRDEYIRRCNIRIDNYSIRYIDMITPERAMVVTRFSLTHMAFSLDFETTDTWVVEDGQWRLKNDNPAQTTPMNAPPKRN